MRFLIKWLEWKLSHLLLPLLMYVRRHLPLEPKQSATNIYQRR